MSTTEKITHTPGPWRWAGISSCDEPTGYYRIGTEGGEDVCRITDGLIGNARLIAAAANSYDRHFGERAVEAAEGDALGKVIEALEGAFEVMNHSEARVRSTWQNRARAALALTKGGE